MLVRQPFSAVTSARDRLGLWNAGAHDLNPVTRERRRNQHDVSGSAGPAFSHHCNLLGPEARSRRDDAFPGSGEHPLEPSVRFNGRVTGDRGLRTKRVAFAILEEAFLDSLRSV